LVRKDSVRKDLMAEDDILCKDLRNIRIGSSISPDYSIRSSPHIHRKDPADTARGQSALHKIQNKTSNN